MPLSDAPRLICKECVDKIEGKDHYETHAKHYIFPRGVCYYCSKARECVDCRCYRKRFGND